MKKWKLDRIISMATLLTSVAALVLVLKRPTPVAQPQTPAQIAANAQSFQDKVAQLGAPIGASNETAVQPDAQAGTLPTPPVQEDVSSPVAGQPASEPTAGGVASKPSPAQVRITSDEVTAALAQASGALTGAQLSANSDLGSMPNILDQQVSFDGDQAHGQFLVNIAGKNVWVTVSGHLGSKDGYATFDPTEFKVGDLNIPVSLVNGQLQQKLAEQHDKLKLPDSVGGIKVEDGQLVLTQK